MNGFELAPPDVDHQLWTKMDGPDLLEMWHSHDDKDRDYGEYHTYEIEWTPAYLSFSIDGEEIRRREGVQGL